MPREKCPYCHDWEWPINGHFAGCPVRLGQTENSIREWKKGVRRFLNTPYMGGNGPCLDMQEALDHHASYVTGYHYATHAVQRAEKESFIRMFFDLRTSPCSPGLTVSWNNVHGR